MNKKLQLNKKLILESIQGVSRSPYMGFDQHLKREQSKLDKISSSKDKTNSDTIKTDSSSEWNSGNSGSLPNYAMQALAMKARLNIK